MSKTPKKNNGRSYLSDLNAINITIYHIEHTAKYLSPYTHKLPHFRSLIVRRLTHRLTSRLSQDIAPVIVTLTAVHLWWWVFFVSWSDNFIISSCLLVYLGKECMAKASFDISYLSFRIGNNIPDSKAHWANMGSTWVLSAPDGPHVGTKNLAFRDHRYHEFCYHFMIAIILGLHYKTVCVLKYI